MKNKFTLALVVAMAVVSLSACGKCEHTFVDATCMAPKTCTQCGATEGELGNHAWVDATCEAPKTCSVCGTTEGEALGHTWEEATYQAPKTCSTCGATEGDKLEARYSRMIDGYLAELDKPYDFELSCYDDSSQTTVGKVVYTNYKTYSADEMEALDGYEWKSVDVEMILGDENCCLYGYSQTGYNVFDYYTDQLEVVENDFDTADVAFVASLGDQKIYLVYPEVEDTGWTGEPVEEYGFEDSVRMNYSFKVMVPVGFDGIVVGTYGDKYVPAELDGDGSPEDVVKNKIVLFRFE